MGDPGVALRDDGNNMEMPSNESRFTPDVWKRFESLRSDWFFVQKDLGMQMAFNRYDKKKHWSRPKYTLMIFLSKNPQRRGAQVLERVDDVAGKAPA